jgi:DNA invertase Pin-like site-specific DNA recombinase
MIESSRVERSGGMAAIYARVSSDRQRREQTIQSQTAALRELAAARGLLITDDRATAPDTRTDARADPGTARHPRRAFQGASAAVASGSTRRESRIARMADR